MEMRPRYRTRNVIMKDICRHELDKMPQTLDKAELVRRITAVKEVLDGKSDRELVAAAEFRGIGVYQF